MPRLTTRGLAGLKPHSTLSDGGARGAGTLIARRLGDHSVMFYFRYTGPGQARVALPLGTYGPHGLTLDAARAIAGDLATQYRAGHHDLRAVYRQAVDDGSARTLGVLLDAYADALDAQHKTSARDVRDDLHRHVRDAWPRLWDTPLADVTIDGLLEVVARQVAAGHLRQAEKIRAYLRAAFAAGIKARHDPTAPATLRTLKVSVNPAAMLTPNAGANRARDRALSLAELRAYWQRIQVPKYAPLRFHLLTGCQRVRQLARVTEADFDADTQSLRLLDPKGRRVQPRPHHVPLLPAALEALHALHGGELGPFLFTFTRGLSGANYSGVRHRVRDVATAMQAAGELHGSLFTPGDLRRTVETRLADAGVSRETRGFLQSHGLGGVQVRHYDRHDTLPETRAALEVLYRLLTGND
ncbi:MAG TPA: hypothetical protein VF292_12005 [Rhodanobacteraceae bacterium]